MCVYLVLNREVSARHTVDRQWNDVTVLLIKQHLNLLPLKGAVIRVSTNPQHMYSVMKSINWSPGLDATVSGVENDSICQNRMRFK